MDQKRVQENFAYLRNVLGVRYLKLTREESAEGPVTDSANTEISNTESLYGESSLPNPPPNTPQAAATIDSHLLELEKSLTDCTRCKLSRGRKRIVFGYGSAKASVMFIGEGPGEQEDVEGLPFVGPAGQLLTKMIQAMGLKREDVYLAGIVKCRPPLDRDPERDEIKECYPFLEKQIQMVNPKIIVALGTFAAQAILRTDEKIDHLRGSIRHMDGRKIAATYHPSFLLRNPSQKKVVWGDLQLVMNELGLKKLDNSR